MTAIEKLQELVDASSRIVAFSGAGWSTESGLPDFRSVDGLYQQRYRYPPEEILSHHFYKENPEEFFAFYRSRMLYLDAKPNAAHKKLAELEQAGKLLAVVTQNIDGLHQLAGSRKVLELHGSVHRNYCTCCGKGYDARFILESEGIPQCSCGGIVKPDVVLYEESLDSATVQKAVEALERADLLIVGGTSLAVYPAAGLLQYYQGGPIVVINKSATPLDHRADLLIQEGIGGVLGAVVVR